jgi:hypothetical protein
LCCRGAHGVPLIDIGHDCTVTCPARVRH